MVKQRLLLFVTIIVPMIFFHGCASLGSMNSQGSKEYNRDFDSMAKIVEKALRGSNININDISEHEGEMVLTVSRGQYVNNKEIQQDKGEVRIIRVSEKKTRVEVDNPDYHFSVPDHQREDYQRIIFTRINSILNK